TPAIRRAPTRVGAGTAPPVSLQPGSTVPGARAPGRTPGTSRRRHSSKYARSCRTTTNAHEANAGAGTATLHPVAAAAASRSATERLTQPLTPGNPRGFHRSGSDCRASPRHTTRTDGGSDAQSGHAKPRDGRGPRAPATRRTQEGDDDDAHDRTRPVRPGLHRLIVGPHCARVHTDPPAPSRCGA